MKFTQEMHRFVTFRLLPVLVAAFRNKIQNLSSWTSKVISRVLTKGREAVDRKLVFRMEAYHG